MARAVLRSSLTTLSVLLLPLLANRLIEGAAWTSLDFAVAGVALFVTALSLEAVVACTVGWNQRIGAALSLVAVLLLVFLSGAVGLIGSETDDFNRLYGSVILTGVTGSALARLQPRGISWTLVAMAGVQAGIGLLALALDKHGGSLREAAEIAGMSLMFGVMFLAAAWLLRRGEDPAAKAEQSR